MATSLSFCEYVCEQIRGNYDVRFRKMFGEYMIYLNDKPVILVCDDTPFIKMLPELKEFAEGLDTGFPYDGAKEHYIIDVDNVERFNEIVEIAERVIPLKKRRIK